MDVNAVRSWGIAVSAGLLAVALAISLQPQAPRAEAQPLADIAQTQSQTPVAPVEFIVRFRGGGPISRAQTRAAAGDVVRAQREIEVQLRRQRSFAGLCFSRFTAGAAETVLRTCGDVAAADRAAVERHWLARLRAMRAVAYADANVTAAVERAPS
jgi:hypothetical protein